MPSRQAVLRQLPLLTAATLAVSAYSVHTYFTPLLNDSIAPSALATAKKQKQVFPPFVPVGWGTNKSLVLVPDSTVGTVKRPTPLGHLGSTPLRELVLAQDYGAAVDANGDCWVWGSGYAADGKLGRGLSGKNIKTLAPGPSKLFAISSSGSLYVFSPSSSIAANRTNQGPQGWWSYLFGSDAAVDYVELKADGGLGWGERWQGCSVGQDHLLATTNKGRAFSLPLSERGNSHRQLGTKQDLTLPEEVAPPAIAPATDIRYATSLTQIPSLSSISISQLTASARTSFALTSSGRILAWGDNSAGQTGLGTNMAVDTIPVPVEIVLHKSYPAGTDVKCVGINAGGQTTFYTVQRSFPGRRGTYIDVLACGSGLQGALGTGQYTSATGLPAKVKTLSGLQEYDEQKKEFRPIGIREMSVSKSMTPHVAAMLDTAANGGKGGKDLVIWGSNIDYQIGLSKRSSTPTPTHLPPLGSTLPHLDRDTSKSEWSPTPQIPLPQDRLQLKAGKSDAYDLEGKLLKKRVKSEETVVAGWGCSVLYNRIV